MSAADDPAAEARTVPGEVLPSDLDRSDWLQLWWGFLWRALCAMAIGMAVGFVVGAVLGFLIGLLAAVAGISRETYRLPLLLTSGLVGLGIGFVGFRYYLGWMLRARFGTLRLALVRS